MSLRKHYRRYIALPMLQPAYRFLYRFALAGMNYGGAASASTSGDHVAIERLATARGRSPLVVFDVGANVGGYVSEVLARLGPDTKVYAFEPSSEAYRQLADSFGGHANVKLVHAGLGAERQTMMLYAKLAGSVLASTYASPLTGATSGEQVAIFTLDEFCADNNVDHIDLLKVDVEGAELDVLRGASRLLDAGAIKMIQFEFGPPSVSSRTHFHDLFERLHDRFDLYRVLPHGLTRLERYEYGLEVFLVTNYLAIARTGA